MSTERIITWALIGSLTIFLAGHLLAAGLDGRLWP